MLQVYRVFLENMAFSYFSKLMEAARRTNEIVCRSSRASSTNWSNFDPVWRKRSIVPTLREGEGSISFDSKKTTHDKKRSQVVPMLPPFPCNPKRAMILLYKWVTYRVLTPPEVIVFPPAKAKRTRCTVPTIERMVMP